MIIKMEFAPGETEDSYSVLNALRAEAQRLGYKVDFIDAHVSVYDELYAQKLNEFGWSHGDDWLAKRRRDN